MKDFIPGAGLAYGLSDADLIQLDEIEQEERCREIAIEINTIRKNTLRELLYASCEIGRLLCEAKEKMPHGMWGGWLSENFQYSQSTANNLMRLHRAYGQPDQLDMFFTAEDRMQIFGSLTPSQAIALLPLSEPERVEFVQTHDMEDTSTRDIEREIKARREAEEQARRAEEERDSLAEDLADAEKERDEIAEQRRELEIECSNVRAELEAARKLADSKAASATASEKKAIKEKLQKEFDKKLEAEKKALSDKLTEEQKKNGELEAKLAEAKREAAKELENEYMKRLTEADERVRAAERKAQNAANADVQKFAVIFEQFQNSYKDLGSILDAIRGQDGELCIKLTRALLGVVEKMESGLK